MLRKFLINHRISSLKASSEYVKKSQDDIARGEIVVPDDESDVVPRDGIDTDEHNDLIAADDYEHEDNFATCIQANIVAALEVLNDLDEMSTSLEVEPVVMNNEENENSIATVDLQVNEDSMDTV